MFFVLSKILAHALKPFVIICGLLTLSWIIKHPKWKKRFFISGICLLLFLSNGFIANEVSLLWEIRPTPFSEVQNHEWGLLLTGVTRYDVGPKDRVYFSRGADRVTHTVQLYKLGKIKKILVTGGSGRMDAPDEIESEEVANALRLMGVPDSVVFLENNSRNTYESAVNSKKFFDQLKIDPHCILVTSAFHMRRSMMCFRKANLNVTPFSVDFQTHKRKFNLDILLVPSLEAIESWQTLAKEWIGIVAYKIAGYI